MKQQGTIRATVGQALVRYLAAQYSERDGERLRLIAGVWGILGHGNVAGLGQALEELGEEVGLRTYRPQNEQAMVHAAVAYAKHVDRLSTFACTASVGPGSLNMVTGAATATVNRLPVLLLPSDIFANRRVDPVLQQLEHPLGHDLSVNESFRAVSRFYARIERPEQLIAALPEAMRVLTDPADTGAVTICLPEDVQAEAYDWPAELFAPRVWRVRRAPAEAALIDELARRLRAAQRPLIVSGGGTIYSGARAELAAFAEAHGLPVAETQAGKGSLAWDHPMNVGPIGSNGASAANRLAAEADFVLAIGTRLTDFTTASMTAFQDPDVSFASINTNAFDAGKLGALAVVGDAKSALGALSAALSSRGRSDAGYVGRIAELKATWDSEVDALRRDGPPVGAGYMATGALSQAEVMGVVNDEFAVNGTVVCAAGSMPGDLLKLWRCEDGKSYHVEYGFSCMGYEVAAGLGIKQADPDRDVVVMVGDGSYLMMNSEIVTAVAEGLRFVIVLVDNGGFQSIHGLQKSLGTPSFINELRHRDSGSGRTDGPYVSVDFAAHAAAMGALTWSVETLGELKTALTEARAAPRVSVIVVKTDPERRVPGFGSWWDVPVAEVTGRESVKRARADYERQAAKQIEHRHKVAVNGDTGTERGGE